MSDTENIQLSIIIPTFNRVQILWDSVRPLLDQLKNNDEIIIVDQNQPPLELPPDLKIESIIRLIQPEPSLTRARNLGIEKASGSHILFLDDDVYPERDLLEKLRGGAEKYPGRVIAGAVDQEDSPPVEGVGFVNLKTGEIKTNYSSHQEMEVKMFMGCHFMLPRSCLLPNPGFYPGFRGSSQGEEIDYAVRLLKSGKKIQFLPGARLYHRKESDGGCRSTDFKNNFFADQCFNEGLFFGRNGNLIYILYFLMRMKNFIEFHSRNESGGHSIPRAGSGFIMIFNGLFRGILSKMAS